MTELKSPADEAFVPSRIKATVLWFCALFALGAAIFPLLRARILYTVNYNEGWNVYTAAEVTSHHVLYGVKYDWTTVNYPMLSFVLMSWLHGLTHDYLFTARAVSILSVIATAFLIRGIVRKLGGSTWASNVAGIFCFAFFCMSAVGYVGSDDPQTLAQAFFVLGFFVYVSDRRSWANIGAAAAIFVFGGCIKHNQIDIPLTVLIDLLFLSVLRAVWFSAAGLALAGVAGALMFHFGGPFFLAEMASPRAYLPHKILSDAREFLLPIAVPLCLAAYMAWQVRRDPVRRIAAIQFVASLGIGIYFSGGKGTGVNIFFSAMLATAMLVGLFFSDVEAGRWQWTRSPRFALWAAIILFASLYFPGGRNPIKNLRVVKAKARSFSTELAILETHPGPAICEDLLMCQVAGKPFVYDPFNATSLIVAGKLDGGVIERNLAQRTYSAVQISHHFQADSEHFTPAIQAAVLANYDPAFDDGLDVLYLPKP